MTTDFNFVAVEGLAFFTLTCFLFSRILLLDALLTPFFTEYGGGGGG